MKRICSTVAILVLTTVAFGFVTTIVADDATSDAKLAPKYTIAEIMNKAHRGTDSLVRTVARGTATDAQKAELLEFYKILAENKPSRGEMADWNERTTLLIEAAQAAVDGNPEATNMLTKASSCLGCHRAHKD